MKKRYVSPCAELICLAPADPVAASWKLDEDQSNDYWNVNNWGVGWVTVQKASVTGVLKWFDTTDGKNYDFD